MNSARIIIYNLGQDENYTLARFYLYVRARKVLDGRRRSVISNFALPDVKASPIIHPAFVTVID